MRIELEEKGIITPAHLSYPVETNFVFVMLPLEYVTLLRKRYVFYDWGMVNTTYVHARFITASQVERKQIDVFVRFASEQLQEYQAQCPERPVGACEATSSLTMVEL